MKKLDTFKRKFIDAAEAGLIESAHEPQLDNKALFQIMTDNSFSKGERLHFFFRLIREILPKSLSDNEFYKKFIYDLDKLPFNPERYEFREKIGEGGGCNVYLLESVTSNQASIALKLDNGPFKDAHQAHEHARELNQNYLKAREIYRKIPDLIPNELNLLMANPKGSGPAVVTLQNFLGYNLRDFFSTPDSDIQSIIRDDENFARRASEFSKITLAHLNKTGEIIDLLGPNNLSIVDHNQKVNLILLDSHLFYKVDEVDEQRKAGIDKYTKKLERYS